MGLELKNISKNFGHITAVNNISLKIKQGSVFGLLGANGAGKTTTMRMILDILRPDEGEIHWCGRPLTNDESRKFGYLPEERGLYPKMKVADQLIYLTRLRGHLSRSEAVASVNHWLEMLDMSEHKNKPVEQLSKGNQQKIQFIAAVAHKPKLVILDEPFTGLDPVNAQVLQQSFDYLKRQGVTLIFSSHQLDQVEQQCTDIALIHQSRIALSGTMSEIKKRSNKKLVQLAVVGRSLDFLDAIKGVSIKCETANFVELEVLQGTDPQEILAAALSAGEVSHFTLAEPSLKDIYLQVVGSN